MVRVECRSESGTGEQQAEVVVYDGDRVCVRIVGRVGRGQGADGGWYPLVELERVKDPGDGSA